jgi:hypothetical protein
MVEWQIEVLNLELERIATSMVVAHGFSPARLEPYFAPAISLARLNILVNIASVSLPVFVFCSDGW